jgi:proliferating cell nuclear antigen
VKLDVEDPVNLSFSARYLNLFSKASSVATQVILSMSAERPLLLEYKLPKGLGELKFYLAPKITD